MKKLIRTSTIPFSLDVLLPGQLRYLSGSYEVVAVSSGGEHLKKVSEREGVRTVAVEMERNISLWKDLVSLFCLIRLFRRERPAIVHSITPKAGLLSMAAAYFAGVPVRMHTFTGLLFPSRSGFMHHLLLFMDRLLCFFSTHVYPEGEGVRRDLQSYKVTRKPLKVIANGNVNGLDPSFFDPELYPPSFRESLRYDLGIGLTDVVFVYVGRLVPDKGLKELLSAFLSLNHTYPSSRLLLVGPFEQKETPLPGYMLNELKSHPCIILTGYQSDVRPYLAIGDVFTFPSYREGFPNVLLQAGAMGLPCIVTDINGSNEIIRDGENGLIVPVRDSESLEKAMFTLLSDPDKRHRLSSVSRKQITSRYDRLQVWECLLREYQSIEK